MKTQEEHKSKSVTEKRLVRKAGRGCPGNPLRLGAVLGTHTPCHAHLSYSEGTEDASVLVLALANPPEMSLTKAEEHI